MRRFIMLFMVAIVPWLSNCALANNIIATIKPFYNLAAAVTVKEQDLHLLIKGNASPHHYHLKPSEIQLIKNADLLIWGGKDLEPYLTNWVATLDPQKVLDVSSLPELRKLPTSTPSDHADPHYWLSPYNGKIIAEAVSQRLVSLTPSQQQAINQQYQIFKQRLLQLDQELKLQLAPLQQHQYMVMHNAYRYFSDHYQFSDGHALKIHAETPLSAKRLQTIHQLIEKEQISCLFSEPQLTKTMVNKLATQLNIPHYELDPIGQDTDLGKFGYFVLLEKLADQFLQGLTRPIATENP